MRPQGTTSNLQHRDPQAGARSPPRIAIACVNCASTKTKCDRQYPCGRCRAKGLTCVSRQRRSGKTTGCNDFVDPTSVLERGLTQPPPGALAHGVLNDGQSHPGTPSRAANGPPPRVLDDAADARTADALFQAPGLQLDEWDAHVLSLGWAPADFRSFAKGVHLATMADPAPSQVNDRDFIKATLGDGGGVDDTIGEDHALLVGDWKHWSICRCSPLPLYPAQDRSKSSIVTIDHNFVRPGSWSGITEDWREKHFEPAERFVNVPLSETTREWLLMIAQRFMRVAMDVHGLTMDSPSPVPPDSGDLGILAGYVRLPPSDALHKYLETVLRNYEPFYPLLPARILEPNQLVGSRHGRGSSLLLFLMFAFGSMLDPAIKARRFSTALTEICRHSIRDVLEKDSGAPESGLLFYCSLMFIIKSAFSGDKAHMNIALAHRHTYLTLMRSAGLFKQQPSKRPSEHETLRQAWQSWVERESVVRLAYGWILVETEISLFYDSQPLLNTSELDIGLPADEPLWLALTAEEWQEALCEGSSRHEWRGALQRRPEHSLRTLFQLLLEDQLDRSDYQPNILHMRLLLYPLHVLVAQLGQLLDCDLGRVQSRAFSNPITQNSSILRFGEIRQLLETWHDAFEKLDGKAARFRAMRNATLMLYHLISLNLYTAFGRMERFAREKYSTWEPGASETQHWIRAPELAVVHCGQVFRLFNESEDELRPIWSAAAIYRATIILWAFSISGPQASHGQNDSGVVSKEIIIDALPFRDQALPNHIHRSAKPHLTNWDGTLISLEDSNAVLTLAMEILSRRCSTTSFSAGVIFKLGEMARAWEDNHKSLASRRRPMSS